MTLNDVAQQDIRRARGTRGGGDVRLEVIVATRLF